MQLSRHVQRYSDLEITSGENIFEDILCAGVSMSARPSHGIEQKIEVYRDGGKVTWTRHRALITSGAENNPHRKF